MAGARRWLQFLAALFALALCASTATAQVYAEEEDEEEVYDDVHYGLGQIESDRMHFSSDDSVNEKRAVPASMCSPDGFLCMELVDNTDGTRTGVVIANAYIESTFQLRLAHIENTEFTDFRGMAFPKQYRGLIDRRLPGAEPLRTNLFIAHRVNTTIPWKFSFKYFYHVGSYLAKHDPKAKYRFPFEGRHKIAQGYGGGFSHKGAQKYSMDVSLKVGTKVFAPRDAIVASIVDDQTKSKFAKGVCPKPVTVKCKTPGSEDNHIFLRFADGTYSYLAHLKHKGVVVKAGDSVKAGQFIGYSGNTGFSRGPHLHTMVNRALPYGDKRRWFFESIEVKYAERERRRTDSS